VRKNDGIRDRDLAITMSVPSPPPLLIFLHLPKTAGSTLARVIERQYPAGAVLPLYDSATGEEIRSIPDDRMRRLRVVMGHFYFGAHRFASRPATYVTVLRDPIERVISHYYYVRREPTHYLYDAAQELSLADYVRSCNLAEPNNDQTRLLCGEYQGAIPTTCTDPMLPLAKENLREHCAVVGLTEDFDRSLLLIKRRLGWRYPFYERQNVTSGRPRRTDLPADTLRVLQAYNRLDIELYDYAKALFQEQVSGEGAWFERQLGAFKRLNAALDTLRSLTRSHGRTSVRRARMR
jgi:hypothetical protein